MRERHRSDVTHGCRLSGAPSVTAAKTCCSTSDVQHEQMQIIGILDPSLEDIRPSLVGCLHRRGTVQRGRTLQLGAFTIQDVVSAHAHY